MAGVHVLATAYVAGVILGLWRADAPLPARVTIALLWPVGVLALALTIPLLLGAALVLFPIVGLSAAGVAALGWWVWRTIG